MLSLPSHFLPYPPRQSSEPTLLHHISCICREQPVERATSRLPAQHAPCRASAVLEVPHVEVAPHSSLLMLPPHTEKNRCAGATPRLFLCFALSNLNSLAALTVHPSLSGKCQQPVLPPSSIARQPRRGGRAVLQLEFNLNQC